MELVKLVAVTVPATETCDPLSVIMDAVTCSNPADFSILSVGITISLPTLLKVGTPIIRIDEVTPPAVFA